MNGRGSDPHCGKIGFSALEIAVCRFRGFRSPLHISILLWWRNKLNDLRQFCASVQVIFLLFQNGNLSFVNYHDFLYELPYFAIGSALVNMLWVYPYGFDFKSKLYAVVSALLNFLVSILKYKSDKDMFFLFLNGKSDKDSQEPFANFPGTEVTCLYCKSMFGSTS